MLAYELFFAYANFSYFIDLRFNISKIWVIFAWPVWLIDWSILSLILDKSFGFKPESSGKILVIKSLSTSFTVFRIDLTVSSFNEKIRQLQSADWKTVRYKKSIPYSYSYFPVHLLELPPSLSSKTYNLSIKYVRCISKKKSIVWNCCTQFQYWAQLLPDQILRLDHK